MWFKYGYILDYRWAFVAALFVVGLRVWMWEWQCFHISYNHFDYVTRFSISTLFLPCLHDISLLWSKTEIDGYKQFLIKSSVKHGFWFNQPLKEIVNLLKSYLLTYSALLKISISNSKSALLLIVARAQWLLCIFD